MVSSDRWSVQSGQRRTQHVTQRFHENYTGMKNLYLAVIAPPPLSHQCVMAQYYKLRLVAMMDLWRRRPFTRGFMIYVLLINLHCG